MPHREAAIVRHTMVILAMALVGAITCEVPLGLSVVAVPAGNHKATVGTYGRSFDGHKGCFGTFPARVGAVGGGSGNGLLWERTEGMLFRKKGGFGFLIFVWIVDHESEDVAFGAGTQVDLDGQHPGTGFFLLMLSKDVLGSTSPLLARSSLG